MSTARIKKDEVVFVRSGESAGKTGNLKVIVMLLLKIMEPSLIQNIMCHYKEQLLLL